MKNCGNWPRPKQILSYVVRKYHKQVCHKNQSTLVVARSGGTAFLHSIFKIEMGDRTNSSFRFQLNYSLIGFVNGL